MKRCPMCRAALDDGARFCIYCASSLDEKTYVITKTYGKKTALKLAAIAVSVILAAAAVISGAAAAVKGRAPAPAPAETESAGTPEYTVTDPEDTTSAEDPAETPEAVTSAPESAVPADMTSSAEATAPETTAPETTTPETTIPETTAPETTVPETTAPETTAPETTVPETTAPETTGPETAEPPVQTEKRLEIANVDSYAGGIPDDPEGKEYLWINCYGGYDGWSGYVFGLENLEVGSNKQLYEIETPERVYFKEDGSAAATALLNYSHYYFGEKKLRLLKYALGMDADDPFFGEFEGDDLNGKPRPEGWRGLIMEAGIEDPLYSEELLDWEFSAVGLEVLSYEYREMFINSGERTIKVTIEKRVSRTVPKPDYLANDLVDYFTLVEYVD